MINFDNSATSFPKPEGVRRAVSEALLKTGGNPGRSGHRLSMEAAEAVYRARSTAAAFFGAETENTVFASNCTHALNLALKGAAPQGCHILMSDLEHNSAARPVYALSRTGCTVDVFHVDDNDWRTVENIERLVRPDTAMLVCTLGSNVTGKIPPYKMIGEVCRRRGLCFVADGAQACGVMDVKLSDGINILCTAGHKSLYGPTGTGLLLTDGSFKIKPVMEGGTGSSSLELEQPDFLPDGLECGTLNVSGIAGLEAGIRFVSSKGTGVIRHHEESLCRRLISGISRVKGVKIYRASGNYLPIVSFNIEGLTANEAAAALSEKGFALRGGLHCAGLAHKALGTAPEGTVRFSPSVFNSVSDTDALICAVRGLAMRSV
ncbi:MAG: aminotransferase class V-fold PLP-dependent enzyme [Oscillospiraceae bacterium]|nr:aminotransferase class V-fold PLP-dependent enzyme [Oscillospiraceae bacterium]